MRVVSFVWASCIASSPVLDSQTTLQRLESNKAEWTLGIQVAPEGNMEAEVEFRKDQMQIWAAQIARYNTDASWTNLQTILLTEVYYLLWQLLTLEECEQILKPVLTQALMAIGLNRPCP